jgi:hypothetical protein
VTIQYGSQRLAIVRPVLRLDAEVLAMFAFVYPGRSPSDFIACKKQALYCIEVNGILAGPDQGNLAYVTGHGIDMNVHIFCSTGNLNRNGFIFAYN